MSTVSLILFLLAFVSGAVQVYAAALHIAYVRAGKSTTGMPAGYLLLAVIFAVVGIILL